MYILEVNHGGGEIHRHFLLPGQTYTLGRKECRILLPAAEPSISRHHATIVVAAMPRYSVLDPAAQLEIRIEDVSKHGTFVDRERVGKDNTRFLYPEDRIRLGLRVTARIIPMVLVLGISPDLTDKSLDSVLDSAVHIGALVVEDAIPPPLQYYEHHTNCVGFLYVAEEEFAMEETMMQALGYGYTLVTPDYIMRLVKSVEETDTLMPSEFPSPSSPSPASMGLRAVHYRRPAQTFFSVTEFLSIGKPIVADVFHGYTFLVLDENIAETYAAVLKLFGGAMESLTADTVPQWRSQHPHTGTYPMTTCVLVAEDDFRIISEEVMERGGGRGAFNIAHTRPNITGYLSLYKFGVCLLPEENIHLSLYRNDGSELNTKTTACYLQRTGEDVLADTTAPTASPSAAPSITTKAVPAAVAAATEAAHRKEGSPSRVMASPLMSPPSSSGVTHVVPVYARRSRENSNVSAPSPTRVGSADRATISVTSSTTTASPSSAAVAGKHSSPRASSPVYPSATMSLQSASSTTPSAAQTTTTAESTAAAPTASTAPAETSTASSAPAAASPPPPALDTETLTSNTVAPSHLYAGSSGSSTAPPDTSSLATSATTTPVAVMKPSTATTAPAAPVSSATTTTAPLTVAPATEATAPSTASPLTDNGSSAFHEAAEANPSVGRVRVVGQRASHPFSLGLRARHSDANNNNNTDDDDGPDGGDKNSTSAADANGEEEAAAAPPARRMSNSVPRRASASGRRPSLSGQPSPVILPLKSEEVVRPRSRAASSSQQTAYAAAVAALGRRSVGHSEDRPPLAPSDEEHHSHLISVEEAQRRSSGSMELSSHNMPPLPPPNPSTSTTAAAAAPGAAVEPSASSPPPVLQRAQPKAAPVSAPSPTAAAAAAAAAQEKTPASGVASTHASVRRGEQRIASASVPTPRRSLVRVNPVLATAHTERSASPQQTHARLKRFTTPERDVVVHGATQVGKSPPRQRVEAVRITAAASQRRASVSREPEMSVPRHADNESDVTAAGSMGNRRSVLRRESVSAVTRPPPSAGPLARRASSSFQRSDSAQLREMATPHRLATSRVSSSVPRTRRSKVTGSVQRQRSVDPVGDDAAAAAAATSTSAALAAQRASIRRRRGSPTQGNGAGTGGSSSGPATSATAALPGQIPGLRGSSAAPVLGGTSNATAETYFRINDELNTHCQKFMSEFVDDFMSDTERVTRSVVRQTYMDAPSKETLEGGVERILEFLQYVNSTEPDIPSMYSTSSTRAACHQVRQKSQYALSKIKACYKAVNCKIPSSLTRARAALSTRNVSPTQRRLNSVAGVHDAGSGRRQSTF